MRVHRRCWNNDDLGVMHGDIGERYGETDSSLKSGPLREEIEKQGELKLIYIDPPFDVGADFSMDIEIGVNTFTKRPNVLEEMAYRDRWGIGKAVG